MVASLGRDTAAALDASDRSAKAHAELRRTSRRLASTCSIFGVCVAAAIYYLTCPGPLSMITTNAAAIAQVPQMALVTIAAVCPFALLCEGTLMSFGARAELVRNLVGSVALCMATGSALMLRGACNVNVIWGVSALFQISRFLSNGLVLHAKLKSVG